MIDQKTKSEMFDKVSKLSPEERENLAVDLIRSNFAYRQKVLDDPSSALTGEAKNIVDETTKIAEAYIELEGEAWLAKKGLVRPQKKVVNGVYIELSCPNCNLFSVYNVERNVDSVIECRSCKCNMRIRKEKFPKE